MISYITVTDFQVEDYRVPTPDRFRGSDPFHRKPYDSAAVINLNALQRTAVLQTDITCFLLTRTTTEYEWFFGLAVVEESGVSTALVARGARSEEDGSILYTDVSNVQTYVGNEVVDTPMGAFETCRVSYRASDGLSR